MPKSKSRSGVSRQVRVLQPGSLGQSQPTVLNQIELARRREDATKRRSDLLRGTLSRFYPQSELMILLHLALGDEGKRVLEEFGGTSSSTEPINDTDPDLPAVDKLPLEALEHENVTAGFIDDIQGLLDGK